MSCLMMSNYCIAVYISGNHAHFVVNIIVVNEMIILLSFFFLALLIIEVHMSKHLKIKHSHFFFFSLFRDFH